MEENLKRSIGYISKIKGTDIKKGSKIYADYDMCLEIKKIIEDKGEFVCTIEDNATLSAT